MSLTLERLQAKAVQTQEAPARACEFRGKHKGMILLCMECKIPICLYHARGVGTQVRCPACQLTRVVRYFVVGLMDRASYVFWMEYLGAELPENEEVYMTYQRFVRYVQPETPPTTEMLKPEQMSRKTRAALERVYCKFYLHAGLMTEHELTRRVREVRYAR